jgi:hypothetical protein
VADAQVVGHREPGRVHDVALAGRDRLDLRDAVTQLRVDRELADPAARAVGSSSRRFAMRCTRGAVTDATGRRSGRPAITTSLSSGAVAKLTPLCQVESSKPWASPANDEPCSDSGALWPSVPSAAGKNVSSWSR